MKKLLVISMLFVFRAVGFTQVQEMEQLTLNIQKLAQMKAMLSSMYNGYNILSNGYNQVSNLAKGNFDLHKNYLNSLLQVSAPVRKYQKIAGIVSSQAWLVKESKSRYQQFRAGLNPKEMLEVSQEYANMIEQSAQNIDQMMLVLSPGQLRMTDAQRLEAIDKIEADVNAKVAEFKSSVAALEAIVKKRTQEKKNIEVSKALLGVK